LISGNKSLRIVFMGTPDFSVRALEAILVSRHEIVGVFSQPPRPKGRGQRLQPSPVHAAAEAHGIPVFTPEKIRKNNEALAAFRALDADIAVVVAYGLILPPEILEAPRFGCLNIHASLLPRWRGAAPIQYAIWKGDTQSGVSIMQMDEGLDTGPVIAEEAINISEDTSTPLLHDALALLGAKMIVDVLDATADAEAILDARDQDGAISTYASMLKKEDGIIDWSSMAAEIDRQVRALNPWPGVWTKTEEGKRLKVLNAERVGGRPGALPGTVLNSAGDVACGDGCALRLLSVQPENASKMDAASAFNGGYLSVNKRLS
jgi:methionyl-tRNA formyltransferase